MRKNFVLDTNVLLHDSSCLNAFADNIVNVPIFVIEELDSFKRDLSELGRNARHVAREIDRYRRIGSLETGVKLENGGTIRVPMTSRRLGGDFSISHAMDSAIMACALDLREREPDTPCVFVTKDTNLRIRADAMGLDAVDYDTEGKEITEVFGGTDEIEVEPSWLDVFCESGSAPITDLPRNDLYPNQYLTIGTKEGRRTVLARINGDIVEPLPRLKQTVWGIRPRNREQHFALDMLLRPDIHLCTMIGKAGTGKTLLALAAGLEQVVRSELYRRLLVSRPIFPMGRDLGYLPGDLADKLAPWMQPIRDNFEFLTTQQNGGDIVTYDELVKKDVIELEALTYIRGRSLPQQFMIVDEAQNLTPHEIKTVLTRAGQDTKIVFTGDPYQIDQPYLDSVNNGLTYVVEKFKDASVAAHVSLLKGERSQLAELAANLL